MREIIDSLFKAFADNEKWNYRSSITPAALLGNEVKLPAIFLVSPAATSRQPSRYTLDCTVYFLRVRQGKESESANLDKIHEVARRFQMHFGGFDEEVENMYFTFGREFKFSPMTGINVSAADALSVTFTINVDVCDE